MKASELLRKYEAGERDFRYVDLRGQSFANQDLSDADFSGADIRGANFKNAILRYAKFTRARAGLQGKWVFVITILCAIAATILGTISGSGLFISFVVFNRLYTLGAASAWAGVLILVVALYWSIVFINSVAVAVATAATGNMTGVVMVAIPFSLAALYAFALPSALLAIAALHMIKWVITIVTIAGTIITITALMSFSIGWHSLDGTGKYPRIRSIALNFTCMMGTNFFCADLTSANFAAATLKNTDLRAEVFRNTSWFQAKQLDLARVGNTALSRIPVRELINRRR